MMDAERLTALLTEIEPQNEQPRQADISLEDPLHDRLRVVLDAIANVLISKAQGEVIAVGMQHQQSGPGEKMILTLASNGTIADRTLEHARKLVHDLQKLGGEFADFHRHIEQEMQTNETESQQLEPGRAPSPWMDEKKFPTYLKGEARSFRAGNFMFSLPKIHQRLHKPYSHTSRGLAFMDIAQELPDDGSLDTVKTLKDVSRVVGWMLRHLPNNPASFPDSKVHLLVDGLSRIADMVRQLFESRTWQADLFQVSPAAASKFYIVLHCHILVLIPFFKDFPLERFLKKISSISNATDTLLKLAYSPRLYRRYLAKTEICVRSLGNSPREIRLPESKQWHCISRRVLANQGADSLLDEIPEEDENSPGFHLQKRFKGKQSVKGPVHCECLLALCLVGDSRMGIPALPYIGVSKLTCLACWEFFGGLRNAGHMFYTKGSHAKAYFPWKFPDVEMDNTQLLQAEKVQILQFLCSRLAVTYTQRFQARERLRRFSDSSADPITGVTHDYETDLDGFDD